MGIAAHTAPAPTSEPLSIDDLVAALRAIIRKGLPVGPDQTPEVLIALRGVYARSINPSDYLSRVKALNQLLTRLLAQLGEAEEATALRTLFGLPAENRGLTLTLRRERAASTMGYGATHFRKHIEARLLRDLAWLVHDDSQTYTPRSRTATPKMEISGDSPTLTAADITEQEELISRIWALVYELRAELIHSAMDKQPDTADQEKDASELCLWLVARLMARIRTYIDGYGDAIFHGAAEFEAESLIRLAGWVHEFTPTEVRRLRLALARAGENDCTAFIAEWQSLSEDSQAGDS